MSNGTKSSTLKAGGEGGGVFGRGGMFCYRIVRDSSRKVHYLYDFSHIAFSFPVKPCTDFPIYDLAIMIRSFAQCFYFYFVGVLNSVSVENSVPASAVCR